MPEPEYLTFTLYGMMASWGDIAVGEYRPTADHPTRSAVLGLLAAALGIRRDEEERLAALTRAYKVAIRVEAPGVLLRDYHTTQVPSAAKKGRHYLTRKDELAAPREVLNTILSTRDYRCDAVYRVYIWCRDTTPPYSLGILAEHLQHPVFTLYLGRKSCPLALPVHPEVKTAPDLLTALSVERGIELRFLGRVPGNRDSNVRAYWDCTEGIQAEGTSVRNDESLNRRRWQFGRRDEEYAMIRIAPGGEQHADKQNPA
jgi:CRISPR system Cascade subunit CasD